MPPFKVLLLLLVEAFLIAAAVSGWAAAGTQSGLL
jgi:hypothetical protein